MSKFEPDPIAEISKIQKELVHFNIELLRPDILKSKDDFSIEGDNIRFGLSSIKGISNSSLTKLSHFKSCASNKFQVFQASTEAGINLGVLSALIQAGALDMGDKYSRSKLVLECQLWKILTPRGEPRTGLSFPKKETVPPTSVKFFLHTDLELKLV